MNSEKGIFLKVAGLSLLFNAAFYFLLRNKLSIPTDTENYYIPLSINLLSGKGYFINGAFYTHHPPLFPLLLAGIFKISPPWDGTNALYPLLVLLLQSFSCGFLYLIGERLFNRKTGLLAAALMACYPFFMVLTATKYAWNTTPLLMFLFYASLALYLYAAEKAKAPLYFLSGLLMGLASLTWAGMVHFWLVLCLSLPFSNKSKFAPALIFLIAGFFIPQLVWGGVVYKNTKQMKVSSAAAPSMVDGLVRHPGSKLRNFETSRRAHALRISGKLETEKQIFRFYANELRERPAETLKFLIYKSMRCWYGADAEKHETPILIIQGIYLLLALYGTVFIFKENPAGTFLLLLSIAYFWGIASLVLSILRYMVPAMGLVMILAAAGLRGIFLTFGRNSRPSL